MLRCGKSVGGGVGCVRKCFRVWGKLWESVLGEVWESVSGCGEVCWGVGVVKKDVGKCGGGMGNPNTSHKIFPQPPHLP